MTPKALDQRQLTLRKRARSRLRRLPAPVWAMAMIYGVGGSMCLIAAVFPVSPTAPTTLATVLGCILLIGSGALVRFGAELSPPALQVTAFAGTICNSVLVASCTTNYGAALNCFATSGSASTRASSSSSARRACRPRYWLSPPASRSRSAGSPA